MEFGEILGLIELTMLTGFVTMPEKGYFHVYLVNASAKPVHFDNMNIRIIHANTIQMMNYYPFGLRWEKQDTSITNNRIWHHGKEIQEDEFQQHGKSLELEDFGARMYDPAIARWWSVDPMASERSWVSPYNFVQNNPINRVDPTGALDEWVEKDGQMMYDNRVTNQEDATALYGEGAVYRPNGYTYTASNGNNIELGDYGFFKSNGQIHSSPDLAQNSLAYTNPTQAMANAQSSISNVRLSYAVPLAIRTGQAADVVTPDPSDALPWKWVGHGVLFLGTAYYIAKMEAEIAGIMRRAGGPQGVQYSLRATATGPYTCYTCGSGTMNLGVGDVWKYGNN